MESEGIYEGQPRVRTRRVFFTGSTALAKGQGVCYDRDTGTAANFSGLRDRYVEMPSTSNNRWFAGVCKTDYRARAGGQFIEIAEPGSVVEVSILDAVTIDSTLLTCGIGSGVAGGRFGLFGFLGRGSAKALQTIAAVASNSAGLVGPVAKSVDGSATVSADGLTITKTALFTNARAGDFVYIYGGATTTTMAAAVTPGRYVIASVTSADAAVLTTSCSAVAGSLACYVVRGNPTAQVFLYEGQESGLTQWVTPLANSAAQSMVGGFTFIFGGATLGTGDSTTTLADGTFVGELKGFKLMGALTTNDWLLTVTTGKQGLLNADPTTALATLEFDGANDASWLQWTGAAWYLIGNSGTAIA